MKYFSETSIEVSPDGFVGVTQIPRFLLCILFGGINELMHIGHGSYCLEHIVLVGINIEHSEGRNNQPFTRLPVDGVSLNS